MPYFNIAKEVDPKTFFSAIPFSGSHEAGVSGVAQGTFDAAATWQNNETDGRWQRMIEKEMISEGEIIEELGIEAHFAAPDPQFITATTTVGNTPGHVDVSLWYVVLGERSAPLDYDRSEFKQVRWFHRDDVPREGCEPELDRFLAKISGRKPPFERQSTF